MFSLFPPKDQILALRALWTGQRIELIHMDDPYCPLNPGEIGSVSHIDDAGTIHMKWDNGRRLGLIPGVDLFKSLGPVVPTVSVLESPHA